MFNRTNIFAAFLCSAFVCAPAFAQQTPSAPPPVEREMRILMTDDGSYLGVQTQEVTKENFSKFNLPDVRGVAIEKVSENSPAAQAGLQANDVIIRFGGEEVTSARKLSRLIGEIAPDRTVKMTVLRSGSERELTAVIGKRPAAQQLETSGTTLGGLWGLPGIPEYPFPPAGNDERIIMFGNSGQIGVGVVSLNKQLGDYFGVTDGKGVLVSSVVENSPAAKAGLKAGDVIVEADGKTIENSLDLRRAVNEKKEGDVNLTIVRSKNRQTVKVTPEKTKNGGNFRIQNFDDGELSDLTPARRPRVSPMPRVQIKRAARTM